MFPQQRFFGIDVEQVRQMVVSETGFERDQAAVDARAAQIRRVFRQFDRPQPVHNSENRPALDLVFKKINLKNDRKKIQTGRAGAANHRLWIELALPQNLNSSFDR